MRSAIAAFMLIFTPVLLAAESPTLEQRVESLEREVQELKAKLNQPAALPAPAASRKSAPAEMPSPIASQPPASIGPPAYLEKANWKKLRYGMLQPQVQAVLGDPVKIEGTRYNQKWLYPDDSAWVQFDSEKEVNGWQAP